MKHLHSVEKRKILSPQKNISSNQLFSNLATKQLVTPLDDEVQDDYVLEELFQFHDD